MRKREVPTTVKPPGLLEHWNEAVVCSDRAEMHIGISDVAKGTVMFLDVATPYTRWWLERVKFQSPEQWRLRVTRVADDRATETILESPSELRLVCDVICMACGRLPRQNVTSEARSRR